MKQSKLGAVCFGLLSMLAIQMGGCPVAGTSAQVIAGTTGDTNRLGSVASVNVLSPVVSLSLAGGSPVEVNWTAIATTNFAVVNVFFDLDTDPDNGNEVVGVSGLGLSNTSAVLDTTPLEAATYNVGVVLLESNEIAAVGYASGQILINQRPELTFTSPRDNVAFDRTIDVLPRFDVSWTLSDPDSTSVVQIFLDPDETPNGNEFLLRESENQAGDSFTFNLPASSFEAGSYRILAIVSDNVSDVAFYAPGRIRLRSRLAGVIDLRDHGTDSSPVEGAVFGGFNPRDNAGSLVDGLGDFDGDGVNDFMIVAQFGKPRFQFSASREGVGEAYLVYGRTRRYSGDINLNSTGTLFRGEVIAGVDEIANPVRPSRGITDVAVLSDWDRDGVRELAFGIPFTDSFAINQFDSGGYFRTGGVIVSAGFNFFPDLGFPGGKVLALSEVGSGPHISSADTPQCPHTFLGPKVGTATDGGGVTNFWRYFATAIPLAGDGPTAQGCRLTSNEFGDQTGESISRYQFDSLVISSPNRDPIISDVQGVTPSIEGAGVVSVFFTRTEGGFPWRTVNAPPAGGDYLGVGEPTFINFLPQEGPYYYIFDDYRVDQNTLEFLTPGYFTDNDNAAQPCTRDVHPDVPRADGSNTVRILGSDVGGRLGNAEGIDDFNGDGLEDLLIGYPLQNGGDGAVYIVFGRLRGLLVGPVGRFGTQIEVDEIENSLRTDTGDERVIDGIRIAGTDGARLGSTQDALGDFNGDGLPDIVVGSSLINQRRGGAVVVYGSPDLINVTSDDLTIDSLTARGLATTFVGQEVGDQAGARVAAAGDIDGDGIQDLLVAAPERSVRLDRDIDGVLDIDRQRCGVVYLIYGSPDHVGKTLNLSLVGTPELPGAVFVGRNSGDQLGAAIGSQLDRARGMAGVGDTDGDGFGDLLLSTPVAAPRQRVEAGEAYLIYGAGD